MDNVLAVLNSVATSPIFIGMAGLGVFDVILHKIPSSKPIGIMQAISAGLKKGSEIALKLASILDKILGQNIKS